MKIFIREHEGDSVWLEQVEPGSSKFRGKLVALALAGLAFFVGDVVRETRHYKQTVKWSAEKVDRFADWLVSDIRKNKNVQVERVGDRVRILVIPDRREIELSKLLPPPPRK